MPERTKSKSEAESFDEVTIYNVFDRKLKRKDLINVFLAILFFGLVVVVLWPGGFAVGKKVCSEHITGFNNKTLPPISDVSITGTCTCPTDPNTLVRGSPLRDALLGQEQRETNSPYELKDCMRDAAEMLQFLQDGELLAYTNTLTKRGINSPAPKHIYYNWNQEKRLCNFHLDCSSMQMCSVPYVTTGIVKLDVPSQKKK